MDSTRFTFLWRVATGTLSAMSVAAAPGVRAAVVVNPTKVQDLARLRQQVNATFADAGWSTPLWFETTPEDAGFAQAGAAVAQGAAVVVACGGDGTVRECARALSNTEVALGILPTGTGNLLANALALPMDVVGAIRGVTAGGRRRIDVGDLEGTTFLVMAGMGFDAEMVGDASERLKAHFGVAAYVWSALRRLLQRPMAVSVRLDGQAPLLRHARCVVVGKVGRLPGGIQLMDVEADDGQLGIAILTANNIRHWLKIVWAVVTRRSRVPRLETYRAKYVRIEARVAQRREIDGDEIAPGAAMAVNIVPRALLLCVPARETGDGK